MINKLNLLVCRSLLLLVCPCKNERKQSLFFAIKETQDISCASLLSCIDNLLNFHKFSNISVVFFPPFASLLILFPWVFFHSFGSHCECNDVVRSLLFLVQQLKSADWWKMDNPLKEKSNFHSKRIKVFYLAWKSHSKSISLLKPKTKTRASSSVPEVN